MASANIDQFLAELERSFAPERARGTRAILQYHFTGDVTGACYAVIDDGVLHAAPGEHTAPGATIQTDFALWQRILAHEVDRLMVYQEGQYTIQGDVELALDSDAWFTH
ncbi:MAG TPA: SCP2 sterol-binding domain-containing protein [Ktedonobacterales bacterium]|nr:SCP2 sterol-binding domain-containing protein [Ktedonobacterales bacterium]